MRILVDQDLPDALAQFAALGDVRGFDGRALRREHLADADALIVRSVTRVDGALLAGTCVRFVGSATAGFDHVDVDGLRAQGIAFAHAAGCNARAVAEYVLAALFYIARRDGIELAGHSVGVVGCGRIGSIVARWAELLGMRVLRCDPPLVERTGSVGYVELSHLLADSDIVTLHVPLSHEGPHPTRQMIDGPALAAMKPGAWLVNTARGEVVHAEALVRAMRPGRIDPARQAPRPPGLNGAILDVWPGEPHVDPALLAAVTIATPHIAGYTVEARTRAVKMVRDGLAAFLGRPLSAGPVQPPQRINPSVPGGAPPRTNKSGPGRVGPADPGGTGDLCGTGLLTGRTPAADSERPPSISPGDSLAHLGEQVRRLCDLEAMDAAMRQASADDPGSAEAFEQLRRRFCNRREFSA